MYINQDPSSHCKSIVHGGKGQCSLNYHKNHSYLNSYWNEKAYITQKN